MDLWSVLYIGLAAILLWELSKRICLFIWDHITAPREMSYGPTHQAYRDWKADLKRRNG